MPSKQPGGNLVSVVIRSIGRPSIGDALKSIERQDHRPIEIVVVNARAKTHPPIPDGLLLPVRLVNANRDLTRPQAANTGLDHCRGDYIIFLDDDDFFEPEHISSLISCLKERPDNLVAYAGTRLLGEKGEVRGELKFPFNRLALLKDNYIQISAALFSAQLLALGCRFDEDMLLFQDWDFWIQACRWTAFAFTGKVTTNWRAYSGNSGAGLGGNLNEGKNQTYARKVRDKWGTLRHRLTEKYRYALERGRVYISTGRLRDAQKWIASAQSIISGNPPRDRPLPT